MHKLLFSVVIICVACWMIPFGVKGQSGPDPGESERDARQKGLDAITRQAVEGQLEFLASDWTEGRHTGRPGAYMAADYIASLFKVYGVQPGGDMETIYPDWQERREGKQPVRYRTFFQNFNLIEYKAGDEQELSLITLQNGIPRRLDLAYRTDFTVQAPEVAMEIEAPVVFAGYGFTSEKAGYDDYKGLDVKGKVVICLEGYPGHSDTTSRAYRAIHADREVTARAIMREKYRRAAEMGIAAMIQVEPGEDPARHWADNIPFRYNSDNYEGVEPRASFYEYRMKIPGDTMDLEPVGLAVSNRVLTELLRGTGIEPEAFEESVSRTLKPASRQLEGRMIRLKTTVESRLVRARNVVGVLPGKDTSGVIVVGGHYDHLGNHDGWIWNGADDNASGTVGVMTIAKACMATGAKPEKTIVFAAWTGEEKGLLGSRYFADHPYNDAQVILNLNYDMISRDNADDTLGVQCSMTYTEGYPVLKELAEKNNREYELGLEIRYRPSERPRGGSDHAPFAAKDIPIFYFMAGFPPEYHQPDDHVELVNYDKMVNIIRIGFLNIWDLANSEWGPGKTGRRP